jgi:hypothetical protein
LPPILVVLLTVVGVGAVAMLASALIARASNRSAASNIALGVTFVFLLAVTLYAAVLLVEWVAFR